jgi:HEAT repeat protein
MFQRMRALFALRAIAAPEGLEAIAMVMLEDPSALLRHECAYVLGQPQFTLAVPHLAGAPKLDPSFTVRHEAAESLGNIATDECRALLLQALGEDPGDESGRAATWGWTTSPTFGTQQPSELVLFMRTLREVSSIHRRPKGFREDLESVGA